MQTKTYKTHLHYHDGRTVTLTLAEKDIKDAGNVYKLIASDARNLLNLSRIVVELYNQNTGKYYKSLTYDAQYERWKERHNRIERIDNDGNRERFYIGKSTGWVPCYLEIKKSNSSGGCSLYEGGIFTVVR